MPNWLWVCLCASARVRERMDKKKAARRGCHSFETTKSCRKPHRYSLAHKQTDRHTHITQLTCVTFDDGGKQFHTEIPKRKVIQMGNFFVTVFVDLLAPPFPSSLTLCVLHHVRPQEFLWDNVSLASTFPHFTSRINTLIRRLSVTDYSSMLQ